MIHKMKLQNGPFCSIKEGSKDIEMRLYDEKRKQINIGDFIEFTNVLNDEKISVEVINLHIFKSFKELYSNFDKVRIGYKSGEKAQPEDMEKYYPEEEMALYGVVGIEIKLM